MLFALCWQVVRKQWKVVLACLLLSGLGAFLLGKWMPPIYQATVLIQVTVLSSTGQADYDSLLASDQLAQTEAQLAVSEGILREVAARYSLDEDQLIKQVSASPRVNTQLFSIDVQDTDPNFAATLANDIASTFLRQQKLFTPQNTSPTKNFLAIVQPAHTAKDPILPDVCLNTLVGLGAGLLLGLLLALLCEQLDTRVRTPEALIQILDWPILGTIWQALPGKESVVNPVGKSPNVEAYRILRANLHCVGTPLQTLAIASTIPHEGKSVIAANLAIFMARSGKNTLLIDADMRCPSIYEKFGLPVNKMGLSNAIMAYAHQLLVPPSASRIGKLPDISLEPFMHTVGIPNLRIMPSGPLPPNPPELLESKGMEAFLAALTHCGAEIIIFDTPPLLGISDSAILTPKLDGTLLVVDMSRSHRHYLLQGKAILKRAKRAKRAEESEKTEEVEAHVVGCVMNKCTYKRKENIYAEYYRQMSQVNESVARSSPGRVSMMRVDAR